MLLVTQSRLVVKKCYLSFYQNRTNMSNKLNRRHFLQTSTLAGAGLAVSTQIEAKNNKIKTPFKSKINLAVIGSGLRGQSHINLALNREDCEVVAIADIDDRMI